MWRVKHIGNGKYVLRHLYKSDMALYRDGTNAVVYNIGLSDSGVSSYAQWSIAWTGDGYVIRGGGSTSFTLQPEGQAATGGTSIVAGNETGNSASRWNITAATDAPTGVYLYDAAEAEMASSEVRYITPEESRTLSSLSLVAVAYSPSTTSQSFIWTSGNTAAATVNSSTGVVTGTAAGTATITGRWSYDTSKTVTYTVNVTEIPSGTYFIQNRRYEKYIQPDNDDAPDYSNNGGIMEQMDFDGGDYQKWVFTHTGDGYYKITSKKSGYAITVPSGEETSKDINLVLTSYTGTNNQKWKITKTTNDSYKIKAKSSEGYTTYDLVMDVEAKGLFDSETGLNIQQREYLDNDSFGDEWYIMVMPTSGSEISYDPSIWGGDITSNTNCYSYALNNQVYPGTNQLLYMQPGRAAGYPSIDTADLNTSKIVERVEADSAVLDFVFESVGKYEKCTTGSYKVALVIAPGKDFHWYRQNPDGTWSHKTGEAPITDLDASGRHIFDPETADRNYIKNNGDNYSVFSGFFRVTPLNHMYSGTSLASGENNMYYYSIRCDLEKEKLPSSELVSKIREGMTYDEVTEILGLPQRSLPVSASHAYAYDFSDGSYLDVRYQEEEGCYYVWAIYYHEGEIS